MVSTVDTPIYLDNHATTALDPRVVSAMVPMWQQDYANPHSVTHALGQKARDLVESARFQIARSLGAQSNEFVFTSGATESNNLALKGLAQRQGRGHIISVVSEHPSVIGPLQKLQRQGFQVTWLPVLPNTSDNAGQIDLNQLVEAIQPDTFLVSVMLANNEIGVIQPLTEICRICQRREGIWVHTDATQAVGKLPLRLDELPVDLMSFTAHKLHGPKGVGALFTRHSKRRVRLIPEMDGGGQESGRRGGTLNTPGIVGMALAMELAINEMPSLFEQTRQLRDRFYQNLSTAVGGLPINGPPLDNPQKRLVNNLNCQFPGIDGHSLMIHTPQLCASTGSACTATNTEPSHVLQAMGLDPDQVRCSLRFGLSRFNTEAEIDLAVGLLAESVKRLRLET